MIVSFNHNARLFRFSLVISFFFMLGIFHTKSVEINYGLVNNWLCDFDPRFYGDICFLNQ